MQCTCKYFVPVVLLPPLEAKRWAPPMPNLQVTCMLPRLYVFVVTVPVHTMQGARARTGKVYSRGVLRF